MYASIPAHPPALLSGSWSSSAGEKNYKPPRRPKDRWPSSGIGPERRNRWHGATGPLEVEASQDGGELGLLRLPRKHKAPDYPCRGTLCGCWFSAGRLMVWSVTRPPPVVQAQLDTPPCPRPPYLTPEANLCVLALGVSRSKADFLPYGPNAGISGRARSFASPEMCLRHPPLVMCLTSWP